MLRCARWSIRSSNVRFAVRTRCFLPSSIRLATRIFSSCGRNLASETIPRAARRYAVFQRIPHPSESERNDPETWVSLLEPALPAHLRQGGEVDTSHNLSTEDVAEILLAAKATRRHSIDILYYLGIEKGRWDVVVWFVKTLVEEYGSRATKTSRLSQTLCSWLPEQPLRELVDRPVRIDSRINSVREVSQSSTRQSLKELTDSTRPENLSPHELSQRAALGQIWRSIGRMTIACADGAIKPEILEIIAYLHHMGIMPHAIYNSKPSDDATAIQHPPMLNLLSSRILVALSDAAWRAHAKLVVDEFQANGSAHGPLRPEVPGMAYRVNVDGLRPEVWLELILWSCLRGGWILEGASILRAIIAEQEPRQWKPLSWRTLAPATSQSSEAWEELQYIFSTHKSSSLNDSYPKSTTSINRTISSEVVNAYVDALLSAMRVGVGERGASPSETLAYLTTLQKFLGRSKLSLGAGSWNAIILRLFDAQDSVVHQPQNFEELISLAPALGEDLNSENVQDLPPYVLDGSALVLGLFHQALRVKIRAGDIRGSLKLFESLQALADKNKHKSVVDFLQKWRLGGATDELFTSNYSGVDYPAFDVQIPTTILGPFVELICDAKAYEFGKWLLYSDEIDGPVLPKYLYGDPAVLPALVRFAAESQDKKLLTTLITVRGSVAGPGEASTPRKVLQSFFESQVNLHRWDAAVRVLKHMREANIDWSVVSVAIVARAMLSLSSSGDTIDGDQTIDGARAKQLFSDMVKGKYDREGVRYPPTQQQTMQLLTIISTVDAQWAQFCLDLRPLRGFSTFALYAQSFNLVLEGIVETYGSVMGRRILGIFWSHAVRDSQRAGHRLSGDAIGEPVLRGRRPSPMEDVGRSRTSVSIPGQPNEKVTIYGGLKPDLMTIRIIFNKTIEEYKQAPDSRMTGSQEVAEGVDTSHSGMIGWASRCLRSLGMANDDIREEIREKLSGRLLEDVEAQLPDLFHNTEAETQTTDTVDADIWSLETPQLENQGTYSPFFAG